MLDPYMKLHPIKGKNGKIADLIITEANQAACKLPNKDRSELIDTTINNLSSHLDFRSPQPYLQECLSENSKIIVDNHRIHDGSTRQTCF